MIDQYSQRFARAGRLRASTAAVLSALALLPAAQAQAEEQRKRPADTTEAAVPAGAVLEQVVVQARNRVERLLEVPIPVAAISGQALERYNALTIQDFANLTPNLLIHASNARQQSIAIRGLGKNTSGNAMSNDSLEPSVGVIIDGVPSAYITQAWGDFADLDHVEVLRGPQGTLLGKNATIGVINVATKAPSFRHSSTAELNTGLTSHGALGGKFSVTGPLVPGGLAYRASVSVTDNPGPFENRAPMHGNISFQEKKRLGARLQFLWLPTDRIRARLVFDRQESSELTLFGEPPLIGDPATFPNGAVRPTTYSSRLARPSFRGYKPLIGNWDAVDNDGSQPYRNSSNGAAATLDWALGGALEGHELTSISSWRNSLFDAKNDSDWTRFDIGQGGAVAKQRQLSQELRISSPVGEARPLDYTAGLYLLRSQVDSTSRSLSGSYAGAFNATNAQYAALAGTSVGRLLLEDAVRGLYTTSATHPETTSHALFTQANWHLSDKATLTLGVRRTTEKRTNDYSKSLEVDSPLLASIAANAYALATAAELNAARAIRSAQLNGLGSGKANQLDATSYGWLVSPSYQVSEDVLAYASVGKGEKSGAAQINTSTFAPFTVAPEKVLDVELGLKGAFLARRLTLSSNLYHTKVTDYQQTLTEIDTVASAATGVTTFRSFLGNAPGVVMRGLEFDAIFKPDARWRYSLGGAYNHANYSDFRNAPCPGEVTSQPGGTQQCDFTGRQLPFAPRITANAGVDFHTPVSANYVLRVFANSAFRSRANYNAGLSGFGQFGAYQLLDGGLGIETRDGKWSLTLVGKNLTDKHYVTNVGGFSTSSAVTATPGARRYVGLTLRVKLS